MFYGIWRPKKGLLPTSCTGYLANIHSVESYYQANKDMLESQKILPSLLTKSKDLYKGQNVRANYHANTSKVSTSQFASGSIIEGQSG